MVDMTVSRLAWSPSGVGDGVDLGKPETAAGPADAGWAEPTVASCGLAWPRGAMPQGITGDTPGVVAEEVAGERTHAFGRDQPAVLLDGRDGLHKAALVVAVAVDGDVRALAPKVTPMYGMSL